MRLPRQRRAFGAPERLLHEREVDARDQERVIAQLRPIAEQHPYRGCQPEEALVLIGELRGLAGREPTHGREVLGAYLKAGSTVMRPLPTEGNYEASAGLLLLRA